VNLQTSIVLGLVFGVLAGACAFVIAYAEYKRNWAFTGNAVHQSLRTAAVTFLLFFLAGIILPWIFRLTVARN
jgi:H+/Cl- antiporter ClcA